MEKAKASRRRGDDLLESLFESTFKLITEHGHDLTFQQIADAAKTSRTVLYRRWPTTFHLLQDIYTHKARRLFDGDFFGTIKDNGSLRSDLIQLVELYQAVYTEIGIEILNNYFIFRMQDQEKNQRPAVHVVARDKHLEAVRNILVNAQSRGEKIRHVSDITMMLPFHLIRMENLARTGNIDEQRLATIVDEILLPVFKEAQS